MPDQQQLYQQHLSQWQAAFGEYWKCCASQGAALPQQWQAMMASGFGGMQYYGGNYMNPYGSMMGAAGQLNNGVQPAAGMAGFGHADSPDTSDTQEDLPSTSMPMALQSPVATVQTASPTSAVAAAGACSMGNTSAGGGSLGGSMGSGMSLQHAGSAGLGPGIDDGQGLHEDRDLKRLRRKQSNRESARRSRLRKQAENDTLQQRLHDCEAQRNTLLAENAALKQRTDQLMLIMAKLSQDKIALLALVRLTGP
eukprot:gene11685-11828_t